MIKVLQCSCPRSGSYGLFSLLRYIMKEEGIYKTYMLESGIGTIIRDNFMEFTTFPSWHEVDNITISNNSASFVNDDTKFMNPINVVLNSLDNSSIYIYINK